MNLNLFKFGFSMNLQTSSFTEIGSNLELLDTSMIPYANIIRYHFRRQFSPEDIANKNHYHNRQRNLSPENSGLTTDKATTNPQIFGVTSRLGVQKAL